MWISIPTTVDTKRSRLVGKTTHFSVYGILLECNSAADDKNRELDMGYVYLPVYWPQGNDLTTDQELPVDNEACFGWLSGSDDDGKGMGAYTDEDGKYYVVAPRGLEPHSWFAGGVGEREPVNMVMYSAESDTGDFAAVDMDSLAFSDLSGGMTTVKGGDDATDEAVKAGFLDSRVFTQEKVPEKKWAYTYDYKYRKVFEDEEACQSFYSKEFVNSILYRLGTPGYPLFGDGDYTAEELLEIIEEKKQKVEEFKATANSLEDPEYKDAQLAFADYIEQGLVAEEEEIQKIVDWYTELEELIDDNRELGEELSSLLMQLPANTIDTLKKDAAVINQIIEAVNAEFGITFPVIDLELASIDLDGDTLNWENYDDPYQFVMDNEAVLKGNFAAQAVLILSSAGISDEAVELVSEALGALTFEEAINMLILCEERWVYENNDDDSFLKGDGTVSFKISAYDPEAETTPEGDESGSCLPADANWEAQFEGDYSLPGLLGVSGAAVRDVTGMAVVQQEDGTTLICNSEWSCPGPDVEGTIECYVGDEGYNYCCAGEYDGSKCLPSLRVADDINTDIYLTNQDIELNEQKLANLGSPEEPNYDTEAAKIYRNIIVDKKAQLLQLQQELASLDLGNNEEPDLAPSGYPYCPTYSEMGYPEEGEECDCNTQIYDWFKNDAGDNYCCPGVGLVKDSAECIKEKTQGPCTSYRELGEDDACMCGTEHYEEEDYEEGNNYC